MNSTGNNWNYTSTSAPLQSEFYTTRLSTELTTLQTEQQTTDTGGGGDPGDGPNVGAIVGSVVSVLSAVGVVVAVIILVLARKHIITFGCSKTEEIPVDNDQPENRGSFQQIYPSHLKEEINDCNKPHESDTVNNDSLHNYSMKPESAETSSYPVPKPRASAPVQVTYQDESRTDAVEGKSVNGEISDTTKKVAHGHMALSSEKPAADDKNDSDPEIYDFPTSNQPITSEGDSDDDIYNVPTSTKTVETDNHMYNVPKANPTVIRENYSEVSFSRELAAYSRRNSGDLDEGLYKVHTFNQKVIDKSDSDEDNYSVPPPARRLTNLQPKGPLPLNQSDHRNKLKESKSGASEMSNIVRDSTSSHRRESGSESSSSSDYDIPPNNRPLTQHGLIGDNKAGSSPESSKDAVTSSTEEHSEVEEQLYTNVDTLKGGAEGLRDSSNPESTYGNIEVIQQHRK